MHHPKRGSALLSALVFGAILLVALGAFVGTAISEYRGSARSAMNTAAFCLAEAGIDRAAESAYADSFATNPAWSATGTTFTRTFAADPVSLGGMQGSYKVVVQKATISGSVSTFTINSRGSVANKGADATAQRAVKVTFTRSTSGTSGMGKGCLAYGTFDGASTGTSEISDTQIGPTYDSYNSDGNSAPNRTTNRGSNCLVGTNSTEHNKLQLGNGEYFCRIGTGGSDQVGYNVSTGADSAILAKSLNLNNDNTSDDTVLKPYTSEMLKRDVVIPPPDMLPASIDESWTTVSTDKAADYRATVHQNVSFSNRTLRLGSSNRDKVYFATTDLGSLDQIDVSGEVILIVKGQPINTNNSLTVNFRTADASLKIYTDSQISGVLGTTQQLDTGTAVQNWEASRLSVFVEPTFTYSAGNTPSQIRDSISASITTATPGSGASTLTMNFSSTSRFVGSIIAPYSFVSLSATGTDRSYGGTGTMSDYCGALIAGSLSVSGSNGFAFHFDEKLGGSSGTNPLLTVSQWQQIPPSAPVFD